MTNFRLQVDDDGVETIVIALGGEIDLYTAPELRRELGAAIDNGARTIVVDLSEVTFIDSTTLGVLLSGLKRLRPLGGNIVIVCDDANVRKVFEITLLVRVFPIARTRAEALIAPVDGS